MTLLTAIPENIQKEMDDSFLSLINGKTDNLDALKLLFEKYAKLYKSDLLSTRLSFIYGIIANGNNNYGEALSYFEEAKENGEKTKNLHLNAIILNEISSCYDSLCNFDNALNFSLQALDLEPNNPKFLNSVGTSYSRVKQNDKAMEYYERSLGIIENSEEDLNFDIAGIYLNIGSLYYQQKNYKKALLYYEKSLPIARQNRNKSLEIHILFGFAMLQHDSNDSKKGLSYLEQAHKLAIEQDNHIILMRILYRLSIFYREFEMYKKSISCLEQYIEFMGKIFNKETTEKVAKLQAKLEKERLEKKMREEELQREKKETEVKLKHLQTAYAEVVGIGKVGVFSQKMSDVIRTADFFHSDREIPVLIEGETGTGKEIIARIIHYGKSRFTGPFIVINCASISPSLFESELFGYAEGAFTGAKKKGMLGKFELAQGGTIFLDEIGELPLELQPKLLRALQQKEIYRIGGNNSIKLDVRVICATNRDLTKEVNEKRFRSDLYYRLNTGRIFIPPLRERKEEIAPLGQMFLLNYAQKKHRNFRYIDEKAIEILENYNWPGNIRELQNAIERIVLLYNENKLLPIHLNFLDLDDNVIQQYTNLSFNIELPEEHYSLKEMETEFLKFILKKFDGNKTQAAEYLKISRASFYRKKIT